MAELVTINLALQATPTPTQDFGISQIFTTDSPTDTTFAKGSSRSYSSLTALSADFSTSSATYKKAQKLLGQNIVPTSFRVYRRKDEVASVQTITYTGSLVSGSNVTGVVNGTTVDVDYDTSSSATMTAIASAIDAVEGVASAVASGAVITVTATTGWQLSLSGFECTGGTNPPDVTLAISTAGVTQAVDVSDSILEKESWYNALTTSTNKGAKQALISGINSYAKFCIVQSTEAHILTSDTDDIMTWLKDNSYQNCLIFYTSDETKHVDAMLAGRWLPKKPGKDRPSRVVLIGSTPDTLTDNEIENITNKNGNYFYNNNNKNFSREGKTPSGYYADTIRNKHYMQSVLHNKAFDWIFDDGSGSDKRNYTDKEIRALCSVLDEELEKMSPDIVFPGAKMNPPSYASIDTADITARKLPDLPFKATVTNGIEQIVINGVLQF